MNLLLRQRARRLQRQYGWATSLSLAALLLLVLWKLSRVLSRLVGLGTASTLGTAFGWVWISWMIMGVVTGRDLTWHVRIERLFAFRVPLRQLYLLEVLLGFVSYPILVMAIGISFYGARAGWPAAHWAVSLIAFCTFVLITRLSVSIIRTVAYRGPAFRPATRLALRAGVLVPAAILIVLMARGNLAALNPGQTLASVFTRTSSPGGALTLLSAAFLLMLADYAMQRHVIRSGVLRPAPAGALLGRLQERLLLAGPPTPSILWRITMLGWLRNRNALLLFIWGTSYGFLYTWFTNASGLSYFLSFAWMVLIFHSYLRGNLFGVDQKGVWFYFLQPVPLRNVLRAKSASMTVLQSVMVAAVLLPALIRTTVGMTTGFAWVCVLGFAASALLVSDIAGQFFSVLHPDPIERGSLYSGGMTMGAFIIPTIHVVLVLLYLGVAYFAEQAIPKGAALLFMIGFPLILAAIRWKALPVWMNQLLARNREEILFQMSAVTP